MRSEAFNDQNSVSVGFGHKYMALTLIKGSLQAVGAIWTLHNIDNQPFSFVDSHQPGCQ
jgi:hypothetical protein